MAAYALAIPVMLGAIHKLLTSLKSKVFPIERIHTNILLKFLASQLVVSKLTSLYSRMFNFHLCLLDALRFYPKTKYEFL